MVREADRAAIVNGVRARQGGTEEGGADLKRSRVYRDRVRRAKVHPTEAASWMAWSWVCVLTFAAIPGACPRSQPPRWARRGQPRTLALR